MDKIGKTVSASKIDGHVYTVFSNDLNPMGTIFGGRIMEIADRLAAACAKLHSGRVCTTLLVDSLRFLSPAREGEILVFKAAVNRTWKTSMEIGMKVESLACSGETRKVVSAYFTMVALDLNLNPTEVIPIIPETADEKRRYKAADERRHHRLSVSKRSQEKTLEVKKRLKGTVHKLN